MAEYRVLVVADEPMYLESEHYAEAPSKREAERQALAEFKSNHGEQWNPEVASEETFRLDT